MVKGYEFRYGFFMTSSNSIITDNASLIAISNQFSQASFLAIDTEFLRESTYYPLLCLIQISDGHQAVAIDPLAPDIDLTPIWTLLKNPDITKVFHAGRQDLEIFVHLMGELPKSIYDTQIAAMVFGLGDQVGYDKLVLHYKSLEIDKSSRFTDWSKRPLSDNQIHYALADVIHLAEIYPKMVAELEDAGRSHWLDEELATLCDVNIYRPDPESVWQKMKIRNARPALLNRLKYLASWREIEAQKRNIPRNRLIRDETLLDLAASNPKTLEAFDKIRGFPGGANGRLAIQILPVLEHAETIDRADWPKHIQTRRTEKSPQAVIELLRVLMKEVCERHKVAPKLLANADDLEALALSDDADIKAMKGWRFEIFGQAALDLKAGKVALAVENKKLRLVTLN